MNFGAVVLAHLQCHNPTARTVPISRRCSTMKRLALALGLSLLLFHNSTNAQDKPVSSDDSSAIRNTVRNYIEGYYTGDAARLEQTLHPHYLKHMIHGDIPMREKNGAQMLHEVRAHGDSN